MHERLKQLALDAVDDLFGDTSVSQAQTLESVTEIRDKCNGLIEALNEDLEG